MLNDAVFWKIPVFFFGVFVFLFFWYSASWYDSGWFLANEPGIRLLYRIRLPMAGCRKLNNAAKWKSDNRLPHIPIDEIHRCSIGPCWNEIRQHCPDIVQSDPKSVEWTADCLAWRQNIRNAQCIKNKVILRLWMNRHLMGAHCDADRLGSWPGIQCGICVEWLVAVILKQNEAGIGTDICRRRGCGGTFGQLSRFETGMTGMISDKRKW